MLKSFVNWTVELSRGLDIKGWFIVGLSLHHRANKAGKWSRTHFSPFPIGPSHAEADPGFLERRYICIQV